MAKIAFIKKISKAWDNDWDDENAHPKPQPKPGDIDNERFTPADFTEAMKQATGGYDNSKEVLGKKRSAYWLLHDGTLIGGTRRIHNDQARCAVMRMYENRGYHPYDPLVPGEDTPDRIAGPAEHDSYGGYNHAIDYHAIPVRGESGRLDAYIYRMPHPEQMQTLVDTAANHPEINFRYTARSWRNPATGKQDYRHGSLSDGSDTIDRHMKELYLNSEPQAQETTTEKSVVIMKAATSRQPNPDVQAMISSYRQKAGLPDREYGPAPLHMPTSMEIADYYEGMPHNPHDPGVAAAYDAFKRENLAQWHHAHASGYTIEPTEGTDPYKGSAAMMEDVRNNKHLSFFPTEGGDGNTGVGWPNNPMSHPMLEQSGVVVNGRPLLHNDIFRGVHDLMGHSAEGYQFGPQGENDAWRKHASMYSQAALPALAGETRMQNSWINAGKHLRVNGAVPVKGEPGFVPAPDRPFAEQKVGVIPQAYWQPVKAVQKALGDEAQVSKPPLTFRDIDDHYPEHVKFTPEEFAQSMHSIHPTAVPADIGRSKASYWLLHDGSMVGGKDIHNTAAALAFFDMFRRKGYDPHASDALHNAYPMNEDSNGAYDTAYNRYGAIPITSWPPSKFSGTTSGVAEIYRRPTEAQLQAIEHIDAVNPGINFRYRTNSGEPYEDFSDPDGHPNWHLTEMMRNIPEHYGCVGDGTLRNHVDDTYGKAIAKSMMTAPGIPDAQVSWESIPGLKTGVIPAAHAAPYEDRAALHQDIHDALFPGGRDDIAPRFGLESNGAFIGPGAYDEGGHLSNNPSTQQAIIPPDSAGELDGSHSSKMQALAATMGLLMRQHSGGWNRMHSAAPDEAWAARIHLGREFSPAEMEALYHHLKGSSAHDHAIVATRDGAHVLNFAIPYDQFHQEVQKATDQVFGLAHSHSLHPEGGDSGLMGNEWDTDKNGEGYVRAVQERGHKEAMDSVLEQYGPVVDQIIDRHAKMHGWGALQKSVIVLRKSQDPDEVSELSDLMKQNNPAVSREYLRGTPDRYMSYWLLHNGVLVGDGQSTHAGMARGALMQKYGKQGMDAMSADIDGAPDRKAKVLLQRKAKAVRVGQHTDRISYEMSGHPTVRQSSAMRDIERHNGQKQLYYRVDDPVTGELVVDGDRMSQIWEHPVKKSLIVLVKASTDALEGSYDLESDPEGIMHELQLRGWQGDMPTLENELRLHGHTGFRGNHRVPVPSGASMHVPVPAAAMRDYLPADTDRYLQDYAKEAE